MVAVHDLVPGGFQVVTPCFNLATVSNGLELTGPLDILIDPGHGGDEPGAVAPNGLVEADVNLDVAELLRAQLIEMGYTAELVRYSDVQVAIQSRAALANALNPRVFLSIHHNGGFPSDFPVAGTEIFVQFDDPESTRLGGLVFEEIQAAFAGFDIAWTGTESYGVAWRQNDRGTDLYGVLRRTPGLVSVLTEAMYMTSPAEAELLSDPANLAIEANAIATALDRWFTTDAPGSGYTDGIVFQGRLNNGGGSEGCVDPSLDS